jgi:predicted Rossmann fold nucleotide-binding protein DprA/Smf involved in DNA uptake
MDNMNKTISENTKVILLLTSIFNNNELRQCKPLTVNGYGYFARWLNTYSYQPVDLLQQEKLNEVLVQWQQAESHIVVKQKVDLKRLDQTINDITPDRIQTLLGRGASLSMAIDKWSAAGIWILDRSHPYYPVKIKKALKEQAPAIFFGVGNVRLLSKSSVGFVGSRDCEQQDVDATKQYVNIINQNGFQVVSGAAKGVDSHSMLASLESGHTSIGILADSLFKASVNKQWRDYLKKEQLVLITPFYPEGKFSPANAMLRNKFIYLLSQASVVIRSTESSSSKKSGTWEGAKENLQKGWTPLMVSEHTSPNYPANQALLNGQIKKSKLQPQKITPSLSSKEFLDLLNEGRSQQVLRKIETTSQQASLLTGDMFESDPTSVTTADIQQRSANTPTNSYTNRDEINVSVMTSLPGNVNDLTVSNNKETKDSTSNEQGVIEQNPNNGTEPTEVLSEKLSLSPTLMTFYQQVTAQIEAIPNKTITYAQLENSFPEFAIISKTALNKWIKYLVEQDYLLQSNARKKVYSIVKQR